MLAYVKDRIDHASQIELFLTTLSEIADQFVWDDLSGHVRAFDVNGRRYCPLSAIVSALYYQQPGVDGVSAGRYLGMSSYTVNHIINAADGAWDSTEDYDLRIRIKEAVDL